MNEVSDRKDGKIIVFTDDPETFVSALKELVVAAEKVMGAIQENVGIARIK